MSSPRGKRPSSWAFSRSLERTQLFKLPTRCGQEPVPAHSLVAAVTSGIGTALGVFCPLPAAALPALAVAITSISASVSKHILTTASAPPLPGVFGGTSTPSPTLCCRWSLASHSLSSLSPLSALLEASVLLFLASCPLLVLVRAC